MNWSKEPLPGYAHEAAVLPAQCNQAAVLDFVRGDWFDDPDNEIVGLARIGAVSARAGIRYAEGMDQHWIRYAFYEGVAVCLHEHLRDGYHVCIQYHPPKCAMAPPDELKHRGGLETTQYVFEIWAEKLRRGELARGTIAAKGDDD